TAQMQYSIYHMTELSHKVNDFHTKAQGLSIRKGNVIKNLAFIVRLCNQLIGIFVINSLMNYGIYRLTLFHQNPSYDKPHLSLHHENTPIQMKWKFYYQTQ
ncbi:MAG: hypothetical protein N0C90_20950, partial [Candidatus Thiodiazotropha endolucinida]|nr:hypothetical protein [Candidatus Thiodiazotropha taylori]MCW4263822.1 hypothetical protein [Candidatus Thiodiazotropha endolucinida]